MHKVQELHPCVAERHQAVDPPVILVVGFVSVVIKHIVVFFPEANCFEDGVGADPVITVVRYPDTHFIFLYIYRNAIVSFVEHHQIFHSVGTV
jgi:hypothetical protein